MGMIGGLDVHRAQITFDLLDPVTGEARHGEIRPATRENLRDWLQRLEVDEEEFALEATTGWRFVVEEIQRAGYVAHLAEPADTRALRGRKRRAKTDRADARHLRELLQTGRLPESWIPPAHIAELRTRVRLRKALVDERTAWQQRAHAILFHNGLPQKRNLLTRERRAWLETVELPEASRASIDTALRMIDHLNEELAPVDAWIRRFAARQTGCRALQHHYGFGPITSAAVLAEFGDVRRFSRSRHAVRHTGLDVTVHESDARTLPTMLTTSR